MYSADFMSCIPCLSGRLHRSGLGWRARSIALVSNAGLLEANAVNHFLRPKAYGTDEKAILWNPLLYFSTIIYDVNTCLVAFLCFLCVPFSCHVFIILDLHRKQLKKFEFNTNKIYLCYHFFRPFLTFRISKAHWIKQAQWKLAFKRSVRGEQGPIIPVKSALTRYISHNFVTFLIGSVSVK